MIDIGTAYSWIDADRPSSLSPTDSYYIGRSQDISLSDAEKRAILLSFYNANIRLPDLQEKAEIIAYCGMRGYELSMIDESGGWLQSAAELFEICADQHRLAVALWMAHIWRRAKGQYRNSYDLARRAVRIFEEREREHRRIKNKTKANWYQGKIQEMTADLVSSPEDVFELLFEFQGSALSPAALTIRKRLSNRVEGSNFDGISRDIELLLGISLCSTRPEETAEAFAFVGVIHWILENHGDAVKYLRSALTQYQPSSFQYPVVQWMAGLVLFSRDPARAISLMEKSVQEFDALRQEAIHQNQMDRHDWFARYYMAMKNVLRRRVDEL